MRQHLNAAEVARLMGVDKSTVVKWVNKGLFGDVARPADSGQYRIPLTAYEAFLREFRLVKKRKKVERHKRL